MTALSLIGIAGGMPLGSWCAMSFIDQLDRARWAGQRFEWGPIVFGPVLITALFCAGIGALSGGLS